MKVKTIVTLLITLCLALAFIGCGDVPQQEIDAAKAALAAAQKAEADKYVPDLYNAAKQALDKAMAAFQEEESSMFSGYDDVKNLLAVAKSAADKAAGAVATKKEELKQEATSLLAQIPAEVKSTMTMWQRAPRGKGTREALQQIKAEIEQADASQAEINSALENGDFITARQKAQLLSKKLKSIQGELAR